MAKLLRSSRLTPANGSSGTRRREGAEQLKLSAGTGVSFDDAGDRCQTVVFREGKHFVAQCLDVDVSSFGDSEDDALANLREALELYFEDAPADAVAKVEGPEVRRLTLERA